MKIYLDGQECAGIGGDGGTSSILSAVVRRASDAGRVITEIRLDDVVMEEEAFLNVSGGFRADFTSQSLRELVLESLDEALKYVPRLTGGLGEIAAHFEKNENTAGEGKLADAAEGLDWLLQVFQKCSSLLAENNNQSDVVEISKAFTESIGSLAALHSEKNYLRMAFFIREQLIPEIDKFTVHVQRLRGLATSIQ